MSVLDFTTAQPLPQVEIIPVAEGSGDSSSELLGIITNNVSSPIKDPLLDLPITVLRFAWQAAARDLLPKERVSKCLRYIVPGNSHVEIFHSEKHSRANYKNLFVCGSVWHCPICAARISESRRVELSGQLGRLPYFPIMVTYTLRHDISQKLAPLLKLLLDAKRKFRQGREWQRIEKDYNMIAALRALEVTHGDNGWHAHIHELVLLRSNPEKSIIALAHELKERWGGIVGRLGGQASYDHGLDISADANDIGAYVTKIGKDDFVASSTWKIEHEIAKGVTKVAAVGGRTPNQLLHDYAFGGDLRAGMLWKDYAMAFKGKKQLWPSSFAALLGEEDLPDGTLAESQDGDALLLARLSWSEWKIILQHEKRGELLEVAKHGDFEMLRDFLIPLGVNLLDPS